MPMSLVLCEWYAVSAMLVTYADKDRRTLASDEDILLFVHGDPVFGKDRKSAVVGDFPHAHQ